MKYSLDICNFLEEISSLSNSIVFLYFLHWSLRKAFLSLLAILWNSAFSWEYLFLLCLSLFFPQLFVKLPQTIALPCCMSFSWGWFWSPPPVQCYKPPSIVLQALCLLDLIPWIYSSPPLHNRKGFDKSPQTEWPKPPPASASVGCGSRLGTALLHGVWGLGWEARRVERRVTCQGVSRLLGGCWLGP